MEDLFSLFQFSINENKRNRVRCLRKKWYEAVEFSTFTVSKRKKLENVTQS